THCEGWVRLPGQQPGSRLIPLIRCTGEYGRYSQRLRIALADHVVARVRNLKAADVDSFNYSRNGCCYAASNDNVDVVPPNVFRLEVGEGWGSSSRGRIAGGTIPPILGCSNVVHLQVQGAAHAKRTVVGRDRRAGERAGADSDFDDIRLF